LITRLLLRRQLCIFTGQHAVIFDLERNLAPVFKTELRVFLNLGKKTPSPEDASAPKAEKAEKTDRTTAAAGRK